MKSGNITRENYESFFLDYLEGNLEETRMDEFLYFIRQNPDLEEELRSFEHIVPEETGLRFSDKGKLYKEKLDVQEVFEQTAVGYIEGDLREDELSSLNQYLKKNPRKNGELSLFRNSILTPDLSVVFKNKNLLYRESLIPGIIRMWIKVAAVLLFFLAVVPLTEKQPAHIESGMLFMAYAPSGYEESFSGKTPESREIRHLPVQEYKISAGKKDNSEINNILPDVAALDVSSPESAFAGTARINYSPILGPAEGISFNPIAAREPGLKDFAFLTEKSSFAEQEYPYLSDRVLKSTGIGEIKLNRIIKWGLSVATGLTNDKFNYSTNSSGEIVALNLDTRLLGFSIPVNRK